MAIVQRLKQMLFGWGTVGLIYSFCDRLQGEGHPLTAWAVDSAIPFSSSAIWLYLSFFLIVPAGYLLVPLSRLRWLACAMQLSALGAGVIYVLWPTTMHYPLVAHDGTSSAVLGWLIAIDSSQNCFPSLHAALTILAVVAIAARGRFFITAASVLWALAIAFSILQLRRHLFIDLLGGALLAWGSGWLAMHLEIRKKQHREIRYE